MKKIYIYYLLLFIVILMPLIVSAQNNCEDSDIGCAYCEYVYKEDTGCYTTFTVTYKNDETPLYYESKQKGSNSGYVACTFSYSGFKKNDFLDANGSIICPKVKVLSEVGAVNGRTVPKKITFSSNTNGSLSSTNLSKIYQPTSTQKPVNKPSYSCKYGDKFTASIINGSVQVTLNGYEDYTLNSQLSSETFQNNKCPDLYYYENVRSLKTFTIYDKYQASCTKIQGQLMNENTGQEVQETQVIPNAERPTYETVLNYNNLCANENIKQAMKIIGYVIQVIRWIVPLMLIVLGMIDFGKSAISSDDSALNKATTTLIRRIIAGIVVFFVPTIVMAILKAIEITNGIEYLNNSKFGTCTKCLFSPFNDCVISNTSNTGSNGGGFSGGGGDKPSQDIFD